MTSRKRFVRPILCWLLITVFLLAGCFPDGPGPTIPPSTTTRPPAPTSTATTTQDELPPVPILPPAPTPAPPYPIPPGSRITLTGQVSTGVVVKVGGSTAERVENTLLSIDDPKSPLYGLELRIPAESHKNDRDYAVSYAPISGTTFKNVNPVSPLITVDNGGDYADKLVTVKVPVKLAADDFAMGFYYDSRSGQLEGLPLLAQDTQSVTIATRHFSSIFISAIKLAALDSFIMSGDIDSGFRPGTDDWQFINVGCYIEPVGICSGMSLTALWYYLNRPDGAKANLWYRYDRNGLTPGTPAIWEDDNQAYRFASAVQHDIDWKSWQNLMMEAAAGQSDALTLRAFAYGMYVTGEPQEVGLYSSKGGGHDVIGYRVKDNAIYVADPNHPGNGERRIEYDPAAGKFKVYNSALSAKSKDNTPFDIVEYCAKTATIDWSIISEHWKDLKAGEAGDASFPDYVFGYYDDKGKPQAYKEGMVVSTPYLFILPVIEGKTGNANYYRDGVLVPFVSRKGISLKPGRNIIGAAVWGMTEPITKEMNYVDFATLDLVYAELAIDPTVIRAQINQDCTYTASFPNPPAGVRYDWLVNGARQQSGSSITFKFRSSTAGTFDIGLKVFDSKGGELGTTSASAIISTPSPTPTVTPKPTMTPKPTPTPTATTTVSRLSQLQKKTAFEANVSTFGTCSYRMVIAGSSAAPRTWELEGGSWGTGGIKITWSGSSFSGNDTSTNSNTGKTTTREVKGTVSADGNTITSLSYSVVSKWKETENKEYQVTAQNIPLSNYWSGNDTFTRLTAAEAPGVVSKVTEKTERAYSASTKGFTETITLQPIDWSKGARTGGAAYAWFS